jgi:hypothetical protein
MDVLPGWQKLGFFKDFNIIFNTLFAYCQELFVY